VRAQLRLIDDGLWDCTPTVLVRGYLNRGEGRQRRDWLRSLREAGHRGRVYELEWDASSPRRFAANVIGFKDWRDVKARARHVGRVVLPQLLNDLPHATVNLVGASAGARIAYHALLSDRLAPGKVNDVILLGAAIKRDGTRDWGRAALSVTGKLINVYSRKDTVLAMLYRAASGGGLACGTGPISATNPRIVNVDVTNVVRGGFLHLMAHGRYGRALRMSLDSVGQQSLVGW